MVISPEHWAKAMNLESRDTQTLEAQLIIVKLDLENLKREENTDQWKFDRTMATAEAYEMELEKRLHQVADPNMLNLANMPSKSLEETVHALSTILNSELIHKLTDAVGSELISLRELYEKEKSRRRFETKGSPDSSQIEISDGKPKGLKPSSQKNKSRRSCFYWKKNGQCKKGKSCRFRHNTQFKNRITSHQSTSVGDINAQCFRVVAAQEQVCSLDLKPLAAFGRKPKSPCDPENGHKIALKRPRAKTMKKWSREPTSKIKFGKDWQNLKRKKKRNRRRGGQYGIPMHCAPPGWPNWPSVPSFDSSAGRGVPPTHYSTSAKKKAAASKRRNTVFNRRENYSNSIFYANAVSPTCCMWNAVCPSPFQQYKARAATGRYIYNSTDNSPFY